MCDIELCMIDNLTTYVEEKKQRWALLTLCEEKHWSHIDSRHKGIAMRETFPYHDILMISLEYDK